MRIPSPPLYNIPSIYKDVESYEEQLEWILRRLEQLNTTVNTIVGNSESYTDSKIAELTNTINQKEIEIKKIITESQKMLESQLNEIKNDTKKEIQNLKEKTELDLAVITETISHEVNMLNNSLAELKTLLEKEIFKSSKQSKNYTDLVRAELFLQLDVVENKLLKKIEEIKKEYPLVYSPPTGHTGTFQQSINDLYLYLRVHGITAEEFDALKLTADFFDALMIRAERFDVEGSFLLPKKYETIFSPFTGQKVTVKEAIYELSNAININGKTALEIDSKNVTVEKIDDANINAYTFDWHKNIDDLSDKYINKKIEYSVERPIEDSKVLYDKVVAIVPEKILLVGHYGTDNPIGYTAKIATTNNFTTISVDNIVDNVETLVTTGIRVIQTPTEFNDVRLQIVKDDTEVKIGNEYYKSSEHEEYTMHVDSLFFIFNKDTIQSINNKE